MGTLKGGQPLPGPTQGHGSRSEVEVIAQCLRAVDVSLYMAPGDVKIITKCSDIAAPQHAKIIHASRV